MPTKKARAFSPTNTAWMGRVCLLLGAAASVITLVVLFVFVWKVAVFAKEAPVMLGDAVMTYVGSEAPELLDAYVEEKLMPGLQEEMLGWIFGPGASDGAPAAGDEVTTRHTTHRARRHTRRHEERRTVAAPQCPVRDPALCTKFRETCTAFDACRTTRDRTTCVGFVRTLNVACAANTCDVYADHSLCDSVNTACSMRMRCMFDTAACLSMEADLVRLCSLVV